MFNEGLLKLTVITVVMNAADRIVGTIESVTDQDYTEIEYIIKDGGSTDGTLEIIKEAASRYPNIRYISSPDAGIYDAMNIAISMAKGDVVEFLNAGDRLATADVVSSAMSVMSETGSDIVFGDVMYENPDGSKDVRKYPQSCARKMYYLTGDCINHQCMFVKRTLLGSPAFDTSLKICADREWMLRVGAYTPRLKMTALGSVVAIYPLDGYSLVNKERYRVEASLCIRRYMPLGYPVYAFFEFMRRHKALADMLHKVYLKLFMKEI